MRWVEYTKKITIVIVVALLAFDVSLIFAAQDGLAPPPTQPDSLAAPPSQSKSSIFANPLQHLFQRDPVKLPAGQQQPTIKLRPNVATATAPGPKLPGLAALMKDGQGMTTEQILAKAAAVQRARALAEQRLKDQAYRAMEEQAFPMTTPQIQSLHQRLDETQRATAASAGIPPKPVSTSLVVSLSPGTTPPVIRLSRGFVSSLVFVDSTGAPWPIQSYDIGNPKSFDIKWDKTSNTLMLQALQPYTYGNIAVKLLSLNTPVMLSLTPGQSEVDYRVDLRVQGIGPKANVNMLHDGMPKHANPSLLSVLNGVPPAGSKALQVRGGYYTQAWTNGGKVFVRTRHRVLSPGWIATMASADGTHAYELPKTSMILVSQNGKVVPIRLEQAG